MKDIETSIKMRASKQLRLSLKNAATFDESKIKESIKEMNFSMLNVVAETIGDVSDMSSHLSACS